MAQRHPCQCLRACAVALGLVTESKTDLGTRLQWMSTKLRLRPVLVAAFSTQIANGSWPPGTFGSVFQRT